MKFIHSDDVVKYWSIKDWMRRPRRNSKGLLDTSYLTGINCAYCSVKSEYSLITKPSKPVLFACDTHAEELGWFNE